MYALDYHKCIACRKGWISKSLAKKHIEYARRMLEQYPTKEYWRRVRFSDKVHFGHGREGRLLIISKKGQRYCQNCIQEVGGPAETEKNKVYTWAAIRYDFKSNLVFYNVPLNTNGKMTLQIYKDSILESVVKE